MKEAKRSKVASMTTTHGSGGIGGKAEGLVVVDQMKIEGFQRLRSEIFTTDFYDRYRDNGDKQPVCVWGKTVKGRGYVSHVLF